MTLIDPRLSAFFAEYEARTNRALADPPHMDIEAAANAFADCFIAAHPHGVMCGKNDDQLRDTLVQGFAFYRSIGTKTMHIVSLTSTRLDEYHTMVKVHWEACYKQHESSEERIDFDVMYLVQMIGESPKIFGYITGDEQKLYKERGLIGG